MVSSSPLLKPVFDATIGRLILCMGIIETRKKSTGTPTRAGTLITFGGGVTGRKTHGGGGRFSQMHDELINDSDGIALDALREYDHTR